MDKALELSEKYKSLLNKNNINTLLRLSHFFAQLTHESGLKPISENLNYSEKGLLTIFKKYFNNITAKKYARNSEAIANKVYANRGGNGNEKSGDGWKYRGKGFIQITLKDNYKSLSKDTGIDYFNNPNLLLTEADSMISSIWYWNKINGNKYADNDDLDTISDLINMGKKTIKIGDSNGYINRRNHLNKLKKLFK
jgi:putative chitinase